jgi:DNA polymerase V
MNITKLKIINTTKYPILTECVKAGFPTPADDFIENKLSLDELLIKHPSSTFFLRVSGNSMINAGIFSEDILIVDKSLEPTDGKIVIAALNGELTVKRIKKINGVLYLVAENSDFKPIKITEETEFLIWGVVISVIHKLN